MQVLLATRFALDSYLRSPPVIASALASPCVGLRHLCIWYCSGIEPNACDLLPRLLPDKERDLPDRPTPPNTPLYLIAMEPLCGGTLWSRLKPASPLSTDAQLLAAADLMAGLMALHSLGFAHSDLK